MVDTYMVFASMSQGGKLISFSPNHEGGVEVWLYAIILGTYMHENGKQMCRKKHTIHIHQLDSFSSNNSPCVKIM